MARIRRIGIVSIREDSTPTGKPIWLLEWRDSGGRRQRRRLSRASVPEQALKTHCEALTAEQIGRRHGGATAPLPLADGFARALELRVTRKTTRAERARFALAFLDWLSTQAPGVTHWGHIRPEHVQRYVNHREGKGDAPDTVRLAVAPIKIAWRHMADNFPEHVRPLPALRIKAPRPKQGPTCLDRDGLVALLDWLKANDAALWPMAVLMGLAGLRELEAAYVRACDWDGAVLHVTSTPLHRLKNEWSDRRIPLCAEAAAALNAAIAGQRIVPPGGEVFGNRKGEPWRREALKSRWRRAWAKLGTETPELAAFPPKRLRASFAHLVGGRDDRALKAYLGHAPSDTLGRHYQRPDPARLAAIASGLDGWREQGAGQDSGKGDSGGAS